MTWTRVKQTSRSLDGTDHVPSNPSNQTSQRAWWSVSVGLGAVRILVQDICTEYIAFGCLWPCPRRASTTLLPSYGDAGVGAAPPALGKVGYVAPLEPPLPSFRLLFQTPVLLSRPILLSGFGPIFPGETQRGPAPPSPFSFLIAGRKSTQ
jgi:hypothetical protein